MKKRRSPREVYRSWSDGTQRIANTITAVGVIIALLMGAGSWGIDLISNKVEGHLATVKTQVDANTHKIDSYISENRLAISRMELMNLMADYPDNKGDILRVAQHYFCDLKGDYVADQAFVDWARKHNVDPGFIENCR